MSRYHYNKKVDVSKIENTYPCNLFLELFPEFGDKFDQTYLSNIKIIMNVIKDDHLGFKIIEMRYKDDLSMKSISDIFQIRQDSCEKLMNEAKNMIKDNKEVIFNGFGHSRLRNKTIFSLYKRGFTRITAAALVDSGLYSVRYIKNLRDGKELIKILSRTLDPEDAGKILKDILITLNKIGYDTIKFGYAGKKYKPYQPEEKKPESAPATIVNNGTIFKIDNYRYDGFSETSFKVQCPRCKRTFRIHIVGYIDDFGILRLEHTEANKQGLYMCQNCLALVSVDKVNEFLKNYM